MPHSDIIEATALRSLLVRYIRHIQVCEGVDYIVSGSHYEDDEFTEEEWNILRSMSAEASAANRGEPKEIECPQV